jgi:hypothetical protein
MANGIISHEPISSSEPHSIPDLNEEQVVEGRERNITETIRIPRGGAGV